MKLQGRVSPYSTYQFLLKLCEDRGDIGAGGGWRETKEAKLAENGGIVVQRLRNLRVHKQTHVCVCRYGVEESIARVLNNADQSEVFLRLSTDLHVAP